MVAFLAGLKNDTEDIRPGGNQPGGSRWHVVALFVGLKLRLLSNSLKGSNARLVAGLIGAAAGFGATVAGMYLTTELRQADVADARLVLVIGGALVILGWFLLPVLIFGVDESIDPQRFALLPLPRRTLLAGMLAAGFIGIPAVVTLVVSLSTAITWSRGVLPVVYAVAGAILATSLCVVASRTITAALSGVFRSRRVRDLVSVVGVLLVGSVALLQLGLPSIAELATRDATERIVDVLAWTPLGAPWAAPYDALSGSPGLGGLRLLVVVAALAVLLIAWSVVLGRSLEHGGSLAARSPRGRTRRHHVANARLTPAWIRWALPATVTGAIASRVLHLWWRDPRQRVSLLIVPVVLIAVVAGPSFTGFDDEVLVVVGPGVGTLIGLMMLNHTAYDGTAIWAHLATPLPGRVDRAGRALGTAIWAVPVVVLAAVLICVLIDRPDLLPAAIGGGAATVLIGLAFASVSSVVIAFPAPPPGANPFTTPSGGNVVVVLQQFVGGLTVGLLSLPVYVVLGMAAWWQPGIGWALLLAGPVYGLLLLRLGNRIGGRYLDEHGPELLRRITPART